MLTDPSHAASRVSYFLIVIRSCTYRSEYYWTRVVSTYSALALCFFAYSPPHHSPQSQSSLDLRYIARIFKAQAINTPKPQPQRALDERRTSVFDRTNDESAKLAASSEGKKVLAFDLSNHQQSDDPSIMRFRDLPPTVLEA